MKKTLLRNAAFGALLTIAVPALATGFVNLPSNGVAVADGRSAYITCNTTGSFGVNPNGSTPPTFPPDDSANNTCAVPGISPPLAGYKQVASAVRAIVMNNAYTLNQPVTVGTVIDRVWRSTTGTNTHCIYGAKIKLNNVDYDRRAVSPEFEYFEMNDFLRSGFKGKGPVAIAYAYTTSGPGQSDDVLYRAGLTSTSVVNFPGDPAQPLTSIAPLNRNAVDFTTDINFQDEDGSSVRDSAWLLVKSSCLPQAPVARKGALRFRQMGQEDQPLLEIKIDGYGP